MNHVNTNELAALPNVTADFAQAIVDWRNTNGAALSAVNYASMNYSPKGAPFETVDELRLVYGASMDLLAGDDLNRNGVLDENETGQNHGTQVEPGLFEYVTAFSREPNIHSDGTPFTNVNNTAELTTLLTAQLGGSRAAQIIASISRRVGGRNGGRGTTAAGYTSMLQFYLRSGMTSTEFAQVAGGLTTTTGPYVYGRVNINTANATVLSCLPGMDPGTAQQLVSLPAAKSEQPWLHRLDCGCARRQQSHRPVARPGRLHHDPQLSVHRRYRSPRALRSRLPSHPVRL